MAGGGPWSFRAITDLITTLVRTLGSFLQHFSTEKGCLSLFCGSSCYLRKKKEIDMPSLPFSLSPPKGVSLGKGLGGVARSVFVIHKLW